MLFLVRWGASGAWSPIGLRMQRIGMRCTNSTELVLGLEAVRGKRMGRAGGPRPMEEADTGGAALVASDII